MEIFFKETLPVELNFFKDLNINPKSAKDLISLIINPKLTIQFECEKDSIKALKIYEKAAYKYSKS